MRWNTGYVDNFAQKERWERSVTRGRFGALTGGVTDDGALVASAVCDDEGSAVVRRRLRGAAAAQGWLRDGGEGEATKFVGSEGERDRVG